MLLEIKGHSNYKICDETYKVFNVINNKEIKNTDTKYCKLKNNDSKWVRVSLSTIKALAGIKLDLTGYTEIPDTNCKYYINEFGNIISFAFKKCGEYLKITIPKDNVHYPKVKILGKYIGIHILLAKTFIDPDYITKGLVCLHLDNDKGNFALSNLKVSTYSENNKQAYQDNLNPGNGLKTNL